LKTFWDCGNYRATRLAEALQNQILEGQVTFPRLAIALLGALAMLTSDANFAEGKNHRKSKSEANPKESHQPAAEAPTTCHRGGGGSGARLICT